MNIKNLFQVLFFFVCNIASMAYAAELHLIGKVTEISSIYSGQLIIDDPIKISITYDDSLLTGIEAESISLDSLMIEVGNKQRLGSMDKYTYSEIDDLDYENDFPLGNFDSGKFTGIDFQALDKENPAISHFWLEEKSFYIRLSDGSGTDVLKGSFAPVPLPNSFSFFVGAIIVFSCIFYNKSQTAYSFAITGKSGRLA